MTNTITDKEVQHVAKLSRLNLSDDEIGQFTTQLAGILEYADKLKDLDTENIDPSTHAAPLKNVFREDQSRPGIDIEDVLKSAPEHDGRFFKVPKVLEDSST